MSISTLGTLFQFIGGLGMFLYGMESMADGLQKFAGNRFCLLYTSHRHGDAGRSFVSGGALRDQPGTADGYFPGGGSGTPGGGHAGVTFAD